MNYLIAISLSQVIKDDNYSIFQRYQSNRHNNCATANALNEPLHYMLAVIVH